MMKHPAHKRILLLLFCAALAWLSSSEPWLVSNSGVEQVPGIESEPEETLEPSQVEEASEEEPSSEEEFSSEEDSLMESSSGEHGEQGVSGVEPSGEESLPEGPEEIEQPDEEGEEELDLDEIKPGSVIVYTFQELRSALAYDNGYVNVFLGADIFISSGIDIHPSKQTVVVDGIDPTDPEKTVHQLTDTAGGQASTVRVYSNAGPKSVTVRNVNILSKNYYGTFNVEDAAKNVVTTYENVVYRGPQISFNRPGVVRYIGDTDITIEHVSGGNESNEVAEAGSVEIGGNVRLTHTTAGSSCFYIFGTDSYINILPYSDVTIDIKARELFYANDAPVAITVGDHANLEITSPYGLAYRESAPRHRVASLDVGKGASFQLTTSIDPDDRSPIRMVGDITVEEGAAFQVFAPFAARTPLITFTTDGAGMLCKDPDSVILYTGGTAPLLRWAIGTGYVDFRTSNLSYWQAAAPMGTAGSLDDPPFSRWQRDAQEELFTIRATVNTSYVTTSLETNYRAEDGPAPPGDATFSFKDVKVMALGRLPLVLGGILEGTDEIIGSTKPLADLRVAYPAGEGSRTLEGRADVTGLFEVAVPDYLEALWVVQVTANRNFLTRVEEMVVTPYDNTLFFLSLPEELHFQSTRLDDGEDMVPRLGDFSISIADRRQYGGDWSLLVRVVQPMTAGPGREIPGGFVYVDPEGRRLVLDGDARSIAGGRTTGPGDILLAWPDDQGILLRADPGFVYADLQYEGILSWTLSDTP